MNNSCDEFSQAVALKLHGVDVDIQVIKRKGEPLCADTTAATTSDATQTATSAAASADTNSTTSSHTQQQQHLGSGGSNSADTPAHSLSTSPAGSSSSTARPLVLSQCSASGAAGVLSTECNSLGKCFEFDCKCWAHTFSG